MSEAQVCYCMFSPIAPPTLRLVCICDFYLISLLPQTFPPGMPPRNLPHSPQPRRHAAPFRCSQDPSFHLLPLTLLCCHLFFVW
ncbi:hypothetical protein BDZ91DRAFT_723138 [Kalaharituber pfeilii]|nr:hypothetical protein BDZ91DRAFT_723138 [Kalaharituber pfeilii]